MKKLNCVFMMIILGLGLLITGCKDNTIDPNGNGNGNGNGNNPNTTPFPTTFGGVTPTHVLGVVKASVSAGGTSIHTGSAFANLNNQDKGSVSVNVGGTDYSLTKSTGTQVSYFFQPSQTNPTGINLGSGTADATFSVSGYTLGSSTVTVPGSVSLTAPAANASVPRNQDLTISWTTSSGGTHSGIFIADKDGKTIFKEVSGSATSASFTAAELGTLAAGTALVYALSYNFVLTNSNEAVIIGEAVAVNTVTLQ